MKAIHSIHLLLTVLILIFGCSSPYDFNAKSIVYYSVDGHVSNLGSSIELTYSKAYDGNSLSFNPVLDATVIVEDSLGNSYQFVDLKQIGLYTPQGAFSPEVGKKYKLKIFVESITIESNYQEMLETVPFHLQADSAQQTGVNETGPVVSNGSMIKTLVEASRPTKYFRWKCNETYTDPNPQIGFVKILYNNNFVMSESDDKLITSKDILFKPQMYPPPPSLTDGSETIHTYTVTEESLTLDAYQYWVLIRKQLDNTGSIFDTMPTTIQGNLQATNSEQNIVLGYFYVSNSLNNTIGLIKN